MVTTEYAARFAGIARLYGDDSLALLTAAHFMVVGIGGVGTWAVEALARTGVGSITLVDLDDVCVSNTNRQIHALSSTLGQSKVAVLARRLADINPEISVHCIEAFLSADNMAELIGEEHHAVLDATDNAQVKSALVAYCSAIKKTLLVVGSAGGKTDPRQVTSFDLAKTVSDPLLAKVRRQLYQRYNFKRDSNRRFNVEAIYSPEQMAYPQADGSVCQQKAFADNGVKLDCSGGFGSATMVTGTFGFVLAARAVEKYLAKARRLQA